LIPHFKFNIFVRDTQLKVRRKSIWIGHILRWKRLLKHTIERKTEGRIEVTGRRRRCEELLGDVMKKEDTGN
jgi:hypothetical protein